MFVVGVVGVVGGGVITNSAYMAES